MRGSGFLVQEDARAFHDDLGAHLVPLQVGGVLLGGEPDLLAIDDEVIALNGYRSLEPAMYGVVLEHVGQIGGFQDVVDADDLQIRKVLHCRSEDHPADTAEAIDP